LWQKASSRKPFLKRLGCEEVHNYLYSKPVLAAEFEALLEGREILPSGLKM
jgi:EAL domain-containing protein (putative c-di-GMP-specific phosphodiesterase class I)